MHFIYLYMIHLSYMAPKIWADILRKVKEKESITAFKHEFKKHYFKD